MRFYDGALAALAFMVLDDRDGAAFILHALSRLVRTDGSLWFGYNTANDWPSEADHDSALVRAGAVSWVGYALAFTWPTRRPVQGTAAASVSASSSNRPPSGWVNTFSRFR